mgnify:CR=1 FL=1
MSFHKQIDPAMAHAVTTDAALMPKRIEIVEIPGTRIFAKIAAMLGGGNPNPNLSPCPSPSPSPRP